MNGKWVMMVKWSSCRIDICVCMLYAVQGAYARKLISKRFSEISIMGILGFLYIFKSFKYEIIVEIEN